MEIEYAVKMTKKECDLFFKAQRSKNELAYKKQRSYINQFKEELISEYHKFDKMYDIQTEKYLKDLHYANYCYENNKCTCGADIEYVEYTNGYSTYECPDYMDKSKVHRVYKRYGHIWGIQRCDAKSWLLDIRNKLGFSKIITAGVLFEFYIENGLEDLYFKYNQIPSESFIYRISDTRYKSKKYEESVGQQLYLQHKVIVFQLGIKYKLQGEQQKICFPDFIGFDDDCVTIYECKTNESDKNCYQKDLYLNLISHMMKETNSVKRLKFKYLIENEW